MVYRVHCRAGLSTAELSRARGRRRMTRQVTPFHFIGSKGEERRYNRASFEANGEKEAIHMYMERREAVLGERFLLGLRGLEIS